MAIDWADPDLFSGNLDYGWGDVTTPIVGAWEPPTPGEPLNLGDSSGWNTGDGSGGSWFDQIDWGKIPSDVLPGILSKIGDFITSPGGAIAGAGILGSIFGGDPKPTTTSYIYSPEATALGQQVGQAAGNLLTSPVQAYTGALTIPRQWEHQAADESYLTARDQAAQGGLSMLEAGNIDDYMNPYAKNAIDPVARMMMEDYTRQQNALKAKAGMKGAFGTTRNALDADLLQGRQERSIGELYQTGLAKAYDSALGQFNTDQARKIAASGATTAAGAGLSRSADALTDIEKFNVTNPYQEFTRQQREPYAKLGAATGALAQVQAKRPTEITTPPGTDLWKAIPGYLATGIGVNEATK